MAKASELPQLLLEPLAGPLGGHRQQGFHAKKVNVNWQIIEVYLIYAIHGQQIKSFFRAKLSFLSLGKKGGSVHCLCTFMAINFI